MGKQRPIDLSAFDEVVKSKSSTKIDLSAFDDVVKPKSVEKKNLIQPVAPTGTKPSKTGFEPFQTQVDTSKPSVFLNDEQKLRQEQDRIGKRFETTFLNTPTEFGKVANFMDAAKKVKDTLPQTPEFRRAGEIPKMQPTQMTEGQRLGESLTKGTDVRELITDKLTGKKTGLQKQIEAAQDAFRQSQGGELVGEIQGAQQLKNMYPESVETERERKGNYTKFLYNQFLSGTGSAVSGLIDFALAIDKSSLSASPISKSGFILDYYRKNNAKGVRNFLKDNIGFEVDKGLEAKYNEGMLTGAIGGLASSAPAMITAVPTMGGSLFAQMYDGALQSIEAQPDSDKWDNDTKTIYAGSLGLIQAGLEKYGLDKILKGGSGQLTDAVFRKILKSAEGRNITGHVLENLIDENVKGVARIFAKGGVRAVDAFATEFFTGSGQETAAIGSEIIFDKATGKPIFNTANKTDWIGFVERIAKAGTQEGIGGFVLGGGVGMLSGLSKKKVKESQAVINEIDRQLDNPNTQPEVVEVLLQRKADTQANIDDVVDSEADIQSKMNPDELTKSQELSKQIDKIDLVLQDPNTGESLKADLESQKEALEKEIDEILKKVPDVPQPTFDTEESIGEEIRESNRKFQADEIDQATWEQEQKDLNKRAENIIPVPEDAEIGKPTFENVPIYTRTEEEIEYAKNEIFDNLSKLEVGSVIENSDGEIKIVTEKTIDKKGNQLIGITTYTRQEDGSLLQMTNPVFSLKSADGKIKLDYNPHETGTNSKGERVTTTDQITDKKIDLSKENVFTVDENGDLIQINKVEEAEIGKPKEVVSEDVEAKKADIEKRRQEELKYGDNYGRISELKRVLDNTIDDTGSRSTESAVNIGDDTADIMPANKRGRGTSFLQGGAEVKLTKEESLERENIESNLTGREKVKARFDLGQRIVKRVLQEELDKINAKYDAELAALEQQTKPTQETTVDALKDIESTTKQLQNISKKDPSKVEKIFGEDIVYHGTKKDFDEFDENKMGGTDDGWYGKGFYFHSDRDRGGYGDIVKAAKIDLKKPIILPIQNSGQYLYDIIGKEAGLDQSFRNEGSQNIIREIGSDRFSEIAKKLGYDGVIVNYAQGTQEVVAFDKKSIKQANPKSISEAYHKAKADGSNPELVQAVEDLLTPKTKEDAIQVETAGQVPVQPEAPVSKKVEQGKPEAKPEIVTEEGKQEEVAFTSKGGNKLVDESGNPLLLYHGTSKGIKATDLKQSGQAGDYGEGIYFTTDKTEAEQRNPENVIEANVKSDNHLVIGSKEYFDGIYKKLEQRFGSVIPQYAIGQEAKKAGYTSIEVDRPNGKFVIVFDGAKIKEATIAKESNQEQTPAQQVEQLRAEEQAELKAAIPNAEQYLTDGKVDRAKITDAKDFKKFDEIYDKYDRLITPLLPEKETAAPKEEAPAKAKAAPKLTSKVDTKLKIKALSDLDNKIKSEKGRAKKSKLEADKLRLIEKNPSIGYVYDNFKNVLDQLVEKGLISSDGKKVVYEGKSYATNDFASVLHDGLLGQMVKDGIVDDSRFKKMAEQVERTEFDSEEDAELYAISRETDPNVIAAKYFELPTAEDTNFKDYQIMQYIGKIKEKDWREYGDINDASLDIRKKYIDFTNKKAMGLDGQAEELQDQLGMIIEPADFLNTILKYKDLDGFRIKSRSNVEQALLERYNQLTGKNKITDAAAKKGFETVNKGRESERKAFVSKEKLEEIGITEEDIATQKEFEEAGFGELETPLEKYEYQKKQISTKGKTELEIKKEILAKAKEMAEAIRGAKIDGKGKAFDATLGLPVAVWNGALETVATAIEAGVAVADAIKRGLNYIQKNNRGAWNKKAYNDRVIQELGLRGIEVNGTDLIVEPLEDKATVELVNGFYSPLEKGIAEAKTDKATGKGWLKVLGGATEKDELNYTGVKDFLNSNADRPISRKELLDYMKNNRIEVVEIIKGGTVAPKMTDSEARKIFEDKGYEVITDRNGDTYVEKDEEIYDYNDMSEMEQDALDVLTRNNIDTPKIPVDTKFAEYQLEGDKENYKEILVTLPSKINKAKPKTYQRPMDLIKAIRFKEISDTDAKKIIKDEYGITEDVVKRIRESDNSPAELNDALTLLKNQEKDELINLEKDKFQSSHFDEPNILVHLRMNTRTDAEGNKVLFLEEVQSDWGQKGKREGFKPTFKLKKEGDKYNIYSSVNDMKSVAFSFDNKEDADIMLDTLSEANNNKIPTAPFVTDTNAWTKLGLKTALKEAVAQNADKLAWTTGEQQNDRYDLSKSVDYIKHEEGFLGNKYVDISTPDGLITFQINKQGKILENRNKQVPNSVGKNLDEVIGKDITERILAATKNGRIEGEGLKVGGKGMKGFYGSPTEGSLGIVGNMAKTLFKQEPKIINFGGKIEIDGENILRDGKIIGSVKKTPFGDFMVQDVKTKQLFTVNSKKEATDVFQEGASTQYSIDITPELKQAVKEGLPLFKNELTQAKEKLKEASAALSKLNRNLGIYADPEQQAKALFEYHKALVGVAKAYINAGVTSVKDFAREMGESLTDEIKDAWKEAKGISKKTLSDFKAEVDTSLVNEEVKLKRDIYGFDEPLLRETKPNPELLEEAIQNIKDGESVYDIIDKVKNGEPITDVESVMLAQFQGTKEAELYKINKKIEQVRDSSPLEFDKTIQKRAEIIDDLIASYDASELSGTVTGRALQARKVRVLQDYSLANMLIRVRKANNNRNLTNEQINEVSDRYNELIEAEAKLKAKVEQLTKENEKLRLNKSEAKLRREAASDGRNRNRAEVKEALKKERSSIIEEMKKILNKNRNQLSMNPIPVEMLPLVGKLAKNYFLDGKTSIEAIVDNVYEDLKDLVDGVTKRDVRDAISGYGRDTRPTQNDLQRELFDLREQAKLISRIEDAEAGVKKAKDDKVRRVASDEVQKLRARLKDLTKGEDSLEAIKKSLKRRINEVKGKIDRKDYSKPEKIEVELDDEAKKLQEAYRKIKFEFDVAVEKDKLANRTQAEKWGDVALEVFNLPRALMATADLSAPLRQGLLPTLANPVMASKAFVEMLKQWNSKDVADTWLADLKDSPGYQLMQQSGLYIADRTNAKATAKEEDFQSNYAERIPVAGKLVAKSERAYVAYLNKMRADLFTKGVNVLQNDGISFANNPQAYKALATYINASTGRGSLGALERAAPILNATFFSPRLMASRVQLLTNWANPAFYKNTPASVRKMYFKDMGTFIAFGMGILALSALSGADVEEDPRSADFGKIRHGNTRWDIWGGFQQFVRYASQFISKEKKSTASGKITPLDGTSYSKETRMSVIGNLIRSKLAPVPSAVVDYLYGENMIGDPFNVKNTIISRMSPLVWQGLYESAQQDGWLFAITATGIPSILGIGVQTYGLNDFLQQGVDDKSIKLLIDKKAVAIEPKENERTVIDAVTGDKRMMDDDEFEKYYASWADYIKNDLKENYEEYNKMSPEKFETEFRKIKSSATSYAKEQVTNVIPETLTLEIDNVTYKLTPDKVAERKEYIQEYIDENEGKRSFERKVEKLIEAGTLKDNESAIRKLLMSEAKRYATQKMKDDYEDNPEELGAIKD
jgi:hypothetical protein